MHDGEAPSKSQPRSCILSIFATTNKKEIEGGIDFHVALEGLVTLLERAERELEGTSGEGEAELLRKGLGVWKVPGQNLKRLGWADIMAGPCVYLQSIF